MRKNVLAFGSLKKITMLFDFMKDMVSNGLVIKNWNKEQANILLKWFDTFEFVTANCKT